VPWRNQGSVTNEECFGGDFAGITSKLDYLQKLGINGIYLTPINEAPSNHKYDTTDYTKIDPRFGDEESFKTLVHEAHNRGIRVMLDGVFNHCGYYFAPWQDVLEKGPESEYYDWFMINQWPIDRDWQAAKKGQLYTFAFFDAMPKLNTNNPKVRKYFVDICANWVENYGIDGLRLDVANEVSHRFCKELHERLKSINPDIYILGEIWHNALPWLRGDEFDAVMNYPLGQSIKDFWIDKSLTNEDFEFTINRCYTSYMQQTNDVLFNLLDSHDTKRLRSDVKNLDEYFAQLAVLFAMPGSPCIYYGTEIAMEGSYDPDCRRCMPWEDIEAGKYDERIRIISTLIELRKKEPLLKSRNFHFPNDYAEHKRVIQFQKVIFPDCYVEVLINCCEEDIEVAQEGEILLERHYIDSTLLSNGILIRRIKK
jgi:glycosidase